MLNRETRDERCLVGAGGCLLHASIVGGPNVASLGLESGFVDRCVKLRLAFFGWLGCVAVLP